VKVKLLLADKREMFRDGLVKLLERQPDIQVVGTCSTGLEAIERAKKHQPDVILIDTELAECNSIEAVQHIREVLPNTNIIMLTHSETHADLISSITAGAMAYVSKDVSLKDLIKIIALVIEGEIVISPPMAAQLVKELGFLEKHKRSAKVEDIGLLSKREQVVLSLVEQGLTNKNIATSLFISEHTVKVHLRNIMGKFHAHTRQQAVTLARGKAARS